jgi:(p)ppGpp synthase/HD superfamily hydrolase
MKIAYEAHKNQVDKGGVPYVFHPFHLAEQMKTEDTVCAALLHDVVEDASVSIKELINAGFSKKVIDALILLTHKKGVPYMEYIEQLSSDPVASKVKLADLIHNSDLSRLDNITDNDLQRVEKYRKAINMIKSNNRFIKM